MESSLAGESVRNQLSEESQRIIGAATSIEEIIEELGKRGCPDLTRSLDLSTCSEFAVAGGGFCDVHSGRLRDGTKIAIKSLRVYEDAYGDSNKKKILKHAARELYHWSRLRHRNVLPLMGLALFQNRISMISGWVDNGDMRSFLLRYPSTNRLGLASCIDVCAGLRYIHDDEMVHGDLKAANVMVSMDGVAMITDFGNANLKDITLQFTKTGKSGISLRWAAPEILQDDAGPSKEADVYAYGMTALETITGKIPFEEMSDTKVTIMLASKRLIPSQPTPSIHEGLWDILQSCWIQECDRRPVINEVMTRLSTLGPIDSSCTNSLGRQDEEEAQIAKLDAQIQALVLKLEMHAEEATPDTNDLEMIDALNQELDQLHDQLNRMNEPDSLSHRTEPPELLTLNSRTREYLTVSKDRHLLETLGDKTRRRRNSSGSALNHTGARDSMNKPVTRDKPSRANNPRSIVVTHNDLIALPPYKSGPERVIDEHAEERARLLNDLDGLDDDVHKGLINGLQIFSPTEANKEVLFPAHLISIISNEMWKLGMIKESQQFLTNTMQVIRAHVSSFAGKDIIVPGVFWLSNVREISSFVFYVENTVLQRGRQIDRATEFDWPAFEKLIQIVKSDLDSLEYNIYHSWMIEAKRKLSRMIIPALIETQSLPGFIDDDSARRLFSRLLNQSMAPAFNMDDVLDLLNAVLKSLRCFFMEESITQQVVTQLLKLIGVTSFNDLIMRRNFCSWKRGKQIQHNITQIDEWCKSNEIPEGTLQLERLLQAAKLLQLDKATQADVDVIYEVCSILTPTQIQRICDMYIDVDGEDPIPREILTLIARRVVPYDRTDHLLLRPESVDVEPYELPLHREISTLEHYVPAHLKVPHIRRLVETLS